MQIIQKISPSSLPACQCIKEKHISKTACTVHGGLFYVPSPYIFKRKVPTPFILFYFILYRLPPVARSQTTSNSIMMFFLFLFCGGHNCPDDYLQYCTEHNIRASSHQGRWMFAHFTSRSWEVSIYLYLLPSDVHLEPAVVLCMYLCSGKTEKDGITTQLAPPPFC